MTTRSPASRAFTLLEVMLALALASIVALSAYGLFEVIRRSERRQFVRMGETDEIARTYKAMERAFHSLVMSDAAMPGDEKALDERLRAFERAVDNDDPDPPREADEPEPRLVLRPDSSSPFLDVEVDGHATRMKAQVFEVALRSPPILGARPDSRIFERGLQAGRRDDSRGVQSRREREDRDNPDARPVADRRGSADDQTTEEAQDPPVIAPGVRGVFELVPDGVDPLGALGPSAGLEGWKPRESSGQGFTLWWRELPPPPLEDDEDSAATDPEGDPLDLIEYNAAPRRSREEVEAEQLALLASARRVPLLTGLRWVRWEVYRGKRFDIRTRATWVQELPGFVKVAFETVEGRKENWMFEVGWTEGAEPGTEVDRATLPNRPPSALDPRRGTTGRERPASMRGRDIPRDGGDSKR